MYETSQYEWTYKISTQRNIIRSKTISGPPGTPSYGWPSPQTFISVDSPDKSISLDATNVPYADAIAIQNSITSGFTFHVFRLSDGNYATVFINSIGIDIIPGTELTKVSVQGYIQ